MRSLKAKVAVQLFVLFLGFVGSLVAVGTLISFSAKASASTLEGEWSSSRAPGSSTVVAQYKKDGRLAEVVVTIDCDRGQKHQSIMVAHSGALSDYSKRAVDIGFASGIILQEIQIDGEHQRLFQVSAKANGKTGPHAVVGTAFMQSDFGQALIRGDVLTFRYFVQGHEKAPAETVSVPMAGFRQSLDKLAHCEAE